MAISDLFSSGGQLSPGVILRRVLFLMLLLFLALYHLFLDFRGLASEDAMDQAQISREIARGNSFTTKCVRPLDIYQYNKHLEKKDRQKVRSGEAAASDTEERSASSSIALTGLNDIRHAPLNPLVNALALWVFQDRTAKGEEFAFKGDGRVYFFDKVIAAVSMLFFLASIGITYLLVARIFDSRIAGVTALLMLFSSLFWRFSQSGLPQMLMLFLFSFALYFLYKAMENAQVGRVPFLWIALAGGFFGLLALTQWLTIWIFMGLLIFVAFYFRPRGVLAFLLFGVFGIIVLFWGIRNYTLVGNVLGSGKFIFFESWAEGGELHLMRQFDLDAEGIETRGFFSRMIGNTQLQINDLYVLLGSLVVAPIFFLSLLHPFKRPEIADFRWCILLMWVFGVIGMTLYSLPDVEMDTNNLHILFAPIMSAYGLAMLSVLWNRLPIPAGQPMLRNGHFIIVILISAIPLLMPLPQKVKNLMFVGSDGLPQWPPYLPQAIHQMANFTSESEIIVADCPWAVAWYSDRTSLWLPQTTKEYDRIEAYARKKGTPLAGIYLTPITMDANLSSGILSGPYKDWAREILYGEGAPVLSGWTGVRLPPPGNGGFDAPFPMAGTDEKGASKAIFFTERSRLEALR